MKSDPWVQLKVFDNKTRMEILDLLLNYEIMSLSEMHIKFEEIYKRKISLPGLLRHTRELENVGIIRQESGGFSHLPDARRRVYIIQGKDRVKEILQSWAKLNTKLRAGMSFNELAKVARSVFGIFATGTIPQPNERKMLEIMIEKCESEDVLCHLMEDEKKKLKFWKDRLKKLSEE